MLIRAVADAELTEGDLLKLSDDGLLDKLSDRPLIQMIRRWSLFKPVFVCGLGNVATYNERNRKEDLINRLHKEPALRYRIEKKIEQEIGLTTGEPSVLIFCPAPNMTLKLVRALVQWKDGTVRRLNEIRETDDHLTFDQVSLLERIYPQLWKLYLFVHPNLRKRGHSLREKFCDALEEELGLNATCDPAFQHYLDGRCFDYKFGKLLDQELEKNPAYRALAQSERVEVSRSCHDRSPEDMWDDDIAEAESVTVASRTDSKALLSQVHGIIDSVLNEFKKSGGGQIKIPNL